MHSALGPVPNVLLFYMSVFRGSPQARVLDSKVELARNVKPTVLKRPWGGIMIE